MYNAASNRLILIPDKVEDKIDGIIIPDPSQGKYKQGIVESVGPRCTEAKIGNKVMFLEGHGAMFKENGVEKLVIQEGDVLCISGEGTVMNVFKRFLEVFCPDVVVVEHADSPTTDDSLKDFRHVFVHHKLTKMEDGIVLNVPLFSKIGQDHFLYLTKEAIKLQNPTV